MSCLSKDQHQKNTEPQIINVAIVGPSFSGKTCLHTRHRRRTFQEVYNIRMTDNIKINLSLFSRLVTLNMWIIAITESHWDDRLRPLIFTEASIIIACFSIDNPNSLTNVGEIWIPGVRNYTTKAPILLVGCKLDVRTDPIALKRMRNTEPVSVQQGREMAKSIDAAMYLECSAKTGQGVDEVFHHAARLSLYAKAEAIS
ncbi:GTP-binding protein Rho1 [Serendipita sp. 407]|nr:GTP-binding protein Rho1 [Serendipita sp. 407]